MVLDLTLSAPMTLRTASAGWRPIDTILVGLITALAGGLRYAGVTQPGGFVFDEHYAADACLFLFGPQSRCPFAAETGLAHPQLGKWPWSQAH